MGCKKAARLIRNRIRFIFLNPVLRVDFKKIEDF